MLISGNPLDRCIFADVLTRRARGDWGQDGTGASTIAAPEQRGFRGVAGRGLRAGVGRGVPHFSIAGTHDVVVANGALPSAEKLEVPGCGHNGVLYDPLVHDEVVSRVRAAIGRGL